MRTVCVTGASRGVGRAVVEQFAAAGDRVIAIGRDARALDETLAATEQMEGQVTSAICDVRDERAVNSVFADIGGIDVLVNNAGVADSAPLERTTLDEWQRHLDTNATGPFICTREVLPGMRAQGFGRVVMIASTAAHVGYRYASAYTASKHALLGLVRAAALEL